MGTSTVRGKGATFTVAGTGGLPPGQFEVDGFPRFGTHLHRPPPTVPDSPVIEITGEVTEPVTVAVAALTGMPRREMTADFHCVAGWSATGLCWEGVPFQAFFRTVIGPGSSPGATHLTFFGADGYRSVVDIRDALGEDVLLADRLNGRPLTPDHGAPVRLVSPSQYGYISAKHLCRIEVHTRRPPVRNPAAIRLGPITLRTPLVDVHPRARVWHEERHPRLPGWSLRHLYRVLVPPIRALSARGSRPDGGDETSRAANRSD